MILPKERMDAACGTLSYVAPEVLTRRIIISYPKLGSVTVKHLTSSSLIFILFLTLYPTVFLSLFIIISLSLPISPSLSNSLSSSHSLHQSLSYLLPTTFFLSLSLSICLISLFLYLSLFDTSFFSFSGFNHARIWQRS